MILKIFFLILSLHQVSSIEFANSVLSYANKNLIDAYRSVRIEFKKKYSAKCFNLLSVEDPVHKEVHEAMKFEIIKYAFEAESIEMLNIYSSSPDPYRNTVLIVDSIAAFEAHKTFINAKKFKYSGFHIVILLNGNIKDVHKIFAHYWSELVYNVIALINQNGTLLLNFEPFKDPQKCGNTSPKIINRFVDGKFVKDLTLIKRFDNLNRCPVNAITFEDAVAVTKAILPDQSTTLRGHEINMIQTIAEMLNFTLKIRFREGAGQWGYIYKNGTCTLGFAELKDKKTDIMIGDMYLKLLRIKYFDSSIPFNNYPVFFVLSPEKKFSWFQKLLKPFDIIVWYLLLLTFCIGITVILIINLKFKYLRTFIFGKGISHPVINMIKIFVGQTLPILPKRNFARFILMMFMIFCFVIRGVYQGFLYKSLQSDGRRKGPQTVHELIDKEYKFIMSEPNLDFFKNYLPKTYDKSKIKEDNEMNLKVFAAYSDRTATLASKFELLRYSMDHDNFPFKICQESFMTINIVMYYSKNFFLKSAIDEALRSILAHGFMDHWSKEFDRTGRWKCKDKRPTVLTSEHLLGAFYLLIIGYVAAILMCLVEMFVYNLNTQ